MLRKVKASCSPSQADFRPKTNAAILWDMGHKKDRSLKGVIGQRKEAKNLNVLDVLTVQERK
jgi:hypothetical protein